MNVPTKRFTTVLKLSTTQSWTPFFGQIKVILEWEVEFFFADAFSQQLLQDTMFLKFIMTYLLCETLFQVMQNISIFLNMPTLLPTAEVVIGHLLLHYHFHRFLKRLMRRARISVATTLSRFFHAVISLKIWNFTTNSDKNLA